MYTVSYPMLPQFNEGFVPTAFTQTFMFLQALPLYYGRWRLAESLLRPIHESSSTALYLKVVSDQMYQEKYQRDSHHFWRPAGTLTRPLDQ